MANAIWFTCVVIVALVLGQGCYLDVPGSVVESKHALPSSQWVEVEGTRVHYTDSQQGSQPLLLLHGTGSSLHTWDGWVAKLTRRPFRVIRCDMPGYGLTGPHASPEFDYSVEATADFVAAVLRAIGVPRAAVAGNSLGGYVAWMLAARHPDMVSKLILEDAAGPFKRMHITPAFRLGRLPVLRLALKVATPVTMVRRTLEDALYNSSLVTDELVALHHGLLLRQGNRGVRCVPAMLRDPLFLMPARARTGAAEAARWLRGGGCRRAGAPRAARINQGADLHHVGPERHLDAPRMGRPLQGSDPAQHRHDV
jgi:pimeloyl-ACP methyl ester carboxylesterase